MDGGTTAKNSKESTISDYSLQYLEQKQSFHQYVHCENAQSWPDLSRNFLRILQSPCRAIMMTIITPQCPKRNHFVGVVWLLNDPNLLLN